MMSVPRKSQRPAGTGRQGTTQQNKRTLTIPHDAAAGKSLAVWLYCLGGRSLAETQRAFALHPEWRRA